MKTPINHCVKVISLTNIGWLRLLSNLHLHVFRGKRNPERYSIHLRLKNLQEHIIRLDINPSNRHTNPDGTVIIGSHIHVYLNQYTKKDATAVLLSESDFPNITHIIDAFDSFLSYTNIRKGN